MVFGHVFPVEPFLSLQYLFFNSVLFCTSRVRVIVLAVSFFSFLVVEFNTDIVRR